jgi:hypothetical protein
MSSNPGSARENKTLGCFPFVIGGLSFIPLLGVLFGLIAIVWGLSAWRGGGKKLALVGAAGIGFTILVYGALFYFGFAQRGGVYDDLRMKLAQSNLNSLVQSVEFYKLSHGEYPDSLETLKASSQKGSFESLYVIDPRISSAGKGDQYFYYRKVDADHYYLRGVAPDGKPFSPGALVPQIAPSGGKLGLLTDPPAAPP